MHLSKKHISKEIFSIILFSLLSLHSSAQNNLIQNRPKVILGILIEGFSDEYLRLLQPLFSENGLKKLYKEGFVLTNVDYGPGIDKASATAMIYTGTSPSINGISAVEKYNPTNQKITSILSDTIKATQRMSPASINVSTLGDEVRLDAGGLGNVYSISPDASIAIISTGHVGNNAFWIDDKTGQWTSSTFYKDVVPTMTNVNFRRPLSSVLDTLSWTPLLDPKKYPDIPDYKVQFPFKYTYTRKNEDRFVQFKNSAKVNAEIANLGCEFINSLQLGTRGYIDMLNLSFTVSPYLYASNSDNRMELIDSYLRLDHDIASVLNTLDKKVGLNNALIFIVGYPSSNFSIKDDGKWGLPTGEFSSRKAVSLLNMYLIALHGNGNWIKGYFKRNFYLNHELIKDKQLDIRDIRAEVSQFLSRMSGIKTSYTIDEVILKRAGENPDALKRNTALKNAGDVLVEIIPGWTEIDDFNNHDVWQNRVVKDTHSPSTAIILAPTVKPQIITQPIDARAIAPTIARIARIRPPNAASIAPISY